MNKFRFVIALSALMAASVVALQSQTPGPAKREAAKAVKPSHAERAAELEKILQDQTIPASARKELESLLGDEKCEAIIESTVEYLKKAGLAAGDIANWQDAKRKDPSCKVQTAAVPRFDFECPSVQRLSEIPQYAPATGIGKSPVLVAGNEYKLKAINTKGLQVEGPTNVVLTYLNRLRYDVGYSIEQTVILNPTPPTTFFPALPPQVTPGAAPPGEIPPKPMPARYTGSDPEELLKAATQCDEALSSRLNDWVVKPAAVVVDNVGKGKASYVKPLETHAGPVLNDKEASDLYKDVKSALPALDAAVKNAFPGTQAEELNSKFTELAAKLDDLAASKEMKVWLDTEINRSRFTALQRANRSDIDQSAKYLSNTDAAKTIRAEQEVIAFWRMRFTDFEDITAPKVAGQSQVNLDNLQLLIETPKCSSLFGNGSHNKISFTVSDLYKSSQQAYPDVLDVVCSPLFNVTGGFGFSTLPQRTAGFLPGKDANGNVVDQITFTDKSSVRPAFAALVNTHLTSGHSWTPQIGIGTAVTNRGDTTNIEFLAGFGVTYKRAIYLTPAFHLGKVTELTGGFKEGDPKGDLTQVPTRSVWRPGFALVITFPLPTPK
jgi:hypothetical protein